MPAVALVVRDAVDQDLAAMTAILNALLDTTTNEWRDEPHTVADRRRWFAEQQARGFPVLVADDGGEVVGFATYDDFRDSLERPGYRFTVEHSIHIRGSHWRSGLGRVLLGALVDRARRAGCHVMVAAIDGENERSLRFHERLGFVQVGRMPQVGAKFGRWLDLVLLQLTLDDRTCPPTA